MNKDSLSWMLSCGHPIIHRGKVNKDCLEHGRSSFQLCIEQNYPMEVDLMMLKDQQIVVWRDGLVDVEDTRLISDLSLSEIRSIAYNNELDILNQLMTLEEFVRMVDGKVGIIFEIKVPYETPPNTEVQAVLSVLKKYHGDFAIHSSNPFVLQMIRTAYPQIPLGQISLSFSRIDHVDQSVVKLHHDFRFTDIIVPDFLSYDVRDLSNLSIRGRVHAFCLLYDIPLISWAIRNAEEERVARACCENYIIEGAVSYID